VTDTARRRALTGSRAWLRATPWIFILAAIAVVQIIRSQPVDAAIFGAGAIALIADTTSVLPAGREKPSIPVTLLIAVGAVAVAVLALVPRHGLVAGIVVGAIGVVAVPIAWLLPPRRAAREGEALRRVRVRRAAIGWACVALLMCLVELWSFLMGRLTTQAKDEHPAISELLDPVLETPVGRIVFVAAWLGIGALLITRGRRHPDA